MNSASAVRGTLKRRGRLSQRAGTVLAALSALLYGASLGAVQARAADVAADVRAELAAGEFGPAIQLASAVQDQATHDHLLREIASAQRAAGAPDAASQTLGMIRDDRVRADAVNGILAQQIGGPDPVLAQVGGQVGGFGGGAGNVGVGAGGAAGGAAGNTTDFDSLISLIKDTIDPDSWKDNGGAAEAKAFAGGVLVDTAGVLRRVVSVETSGRLEETRRQAATRGDNNEVHRSSTLRKISLMRLERAIQMLRAEGREPDEAMQLLAGLQRIQYVLVYPETGDLVLAGPAGDWRRVAEGRVVSVENGHPVLQLDDLVVILRHVAGKGQARFGCSIDPLPENLARTKQFVADSAAHPLAPGRAAREEFAEAIRSRMGRQKIDVYGIDPRTRVGRVLVEADYRMKLVGLGLEPGAGDLVSYWNSLGSNAPAEMKLNRWWFALNYDAVQATPDRQAFALHGQGVKLLSENEMLAEQGRRIPTGTADELNRKFAQSFTRNFPALAAKYPIYAELQNLFDIALVSALITSEDLPAKVHWHMSGLTDDGQYHVALGPAPKMVDSVVRERPTGDGHVTVQVSGGVRVDASPLVARDRIQTVSSGALPSEQGHSRPAEMPIASWWWD